MAAVLAAVQVSAQGSGSTTQHCADHLALLAREHASVLRLEPRSSIAKHISDFQAAAHDDTSSLLVVSLGISDGAIAIAIVLGTARSSCAEIWVYSAVVRRLPCPNSIWMMRRLVPASSKCVAKLCLNVCIDTRF